LVGRHAERLHKKYYIVPECKVARDLKNPLSEATFGYLFRCLYHRRLAVEDDVPAFRASYDYSCSVVRQENLLAYDLFGLCICAGCD
jgi:hypothetical protein